MARKDVSSIESGMGASASIIHSLFQKARKRGVPDGVIHSLSTPQGEGLLDKFVEILASAANTLAGVYQLVVNYCMGLDEMIRAGKYDWINSDITSENFPITAHGKVEIVAEVIHLNREVSSDEAIAELEHIGYRPGTLPELLAFGEKHPNVQRGFPIVALGSVSRVEGGRLVACLWSNGSKRKLNLHWFDNRWYANYRFLAVRK
ncbi:MAG: hypothetical protein Q8L47_01170 [bacterium]|nr:hypothetical protein [bacterium]